MIELPWQPLTRRQPDPGVVEAMEKMAGGHRVFDELWTNDEYEVFVRYLGDETRGLAGPLHLSIKLYTRECARDWRELQAIKNDICGWEREAVEMFPAESRLVDQANQTHLWVLDAREKLPIGFSERSVMTEEESRASRKAHKDLLASIGEDKGKQRAWRPGISTGPNYKGFR
jgi:hypothetical protein